MMRRSARLLLVGTVFSLGMHAQSIAAEPGAVTSTCVISAPDAALDLRISPTGAPRFTIAVRGAEARLQPIEDRIVVSRPLHIETTGALEQPLRLAQTFPLPGGLGYVGPEEELALSREQQTLQATAKLGYVNVGPLPIACEQLVLGEKNERRRSRRRDRSGVAPEPDSLAARMDTLFASAKGIWIGKVPTVRMYAAAKDDAPYVELRGARAEDLRLTGLGSDGVFVRAGVRGSSAAVAGYVKASDVEPEQPRLSGGLGMLGGSCPQEVLPSADYVGEAEVAAGTRIYAAPGLGPWAELPTARKLAVRWKAAGKVDGSEWVRITAIPGVDEVVSRSRYEQDCARSLQHAYVPLSAVSIPNLAELREKAEAQRVPPLGVKGIAAARKRLGLDSDAVGTLSVAGDLGCYIKKGRVFCFDDVPGTAGSDGVIELPGVSDAVQVAVSELSVCVVRSDGGVACLGELPVRDTKSFAPIAALSSSIALAFTARRLHAVRADGRLSVVNDRGQVTDIEGISDAVSISSSSGHACVLRASGTAACLGGNSSGQLGTGNTRPHAGIAEIKLADVVRIAAGRSHTCAQTADGSLYCFGQNSRGELAPGNRDLQTPTLVTARSLREIAAGEGYTCGISTAGVTCFGKGVLEETLAAGGFSYQGSTVEIPGLAGARRLAMSGNRACAMLDSGKVRCWGARTVRTPVAVAGPLLNNNQPQPVRKLRAGYRSMCAMVEDGAVRCWPGERYSHELSASPGARDFAVAAASLCRIEASGGVTCLHGMAPPGEGPASAVALGTSISCVVRVGKLRCTGSGASIDMHEELQGEVVQAAAGFRRACAVEKSGRVICFEAQERGGEKPTQTPQVLPGVVDAVEVAVTTSVTCVRHRDGRISCDSGRGLEQLASVTDAVSLSVGETRVCAVRRDGSVWCAPFEYGFGSQRRGYKAMTPVAGLTDAVEVAVGDGATCARRKSGGVSCFGRCDGGRCDGSPQPYLVPGS